MDSCLSSVTACVVLDVLSSRARLRACLLSDAVFQRMLEDAGLPSSKAGPARCCEKLLVNAEL